jgi:DHA1 family inner membrane transport protein
MVGELEPEVRRSMHIDLLAACIRSVMTTFISFIPMILWRAEGGASTELLATYFAITVLGLISTGISLRLMRRWGMKRVAMLCWLLGRGSFLLTAWAFNAISLLLIFTVFWVLEAWTAPAYNQTMQTIYPTPQRGRILAAVRVGLVACTLVLTPLAGWILDHLGYRGLLPLVGLSGIGSTLIFFSLLRKIPDESFAKRAQVTWLISREAQTVFQVGREKASGPAPAAVSAWYILKTDQRMQIYLAGVLLFGLGILISAPLYPAIQVDRLNLSYTSIGQLGFLQSLFWLLGCLLGGRILDRIGGIRSLQIIFVINAFVMLPYIWATQGWMLWPSFAAAGLVTAGTDLAIIYTVIHLAGSEHVPEYSVLNASLFGFRGLLGPFIGSSLVRIGLPIWMIFSLSVCLTLSAAALFSRNVQK